MRPDLIIAYFAGFATAAVIGLVLYRFRSQIASARQDATSQAGATRQFITNSTEARYYNEFSKTWNAQHIAGDIVELKEIFVEPQFLRAIAPADPTAEKLNDVFHVVPQIHDFSASYAPYNVESLSINDLRAGDKHLALLGMPGTGKSTTLTIMALIAAGEIELEALDEESDKIFEQETEGMSPDDKMKYLQKRKDTQDRAMEYLKQSQKKTEEEGDAIPLVELKGLLPILVHMRDIDLRPEGYGVQTASGGKPGKDGKVAKPAPSKPVKSLDPAEPLVKAMQSYANVVTASTLPGMAYTRLTAGTCLVLIDGFDDLSAAERPEKLAWLRQFLESYGANFIVVTGPASGFDPLVNLGLTPIYQRAWMDKDYDRLVQRWTFAWPAIAGTARKPAPIPEEKVVRRAATNNRGRTPLDVTLKTWSAFRGDEHETGRRGWYDAYVRLRLNVKDSRPVLEAIAAAIVEQGGAPLGKEQLKAAATGSGVKINFDEVISKLTGRDARLMDTVPGESFIFSHSAITAYLAGEVLIKRDAAGVAAAATNPNWEAAIIFAAAAAPLEAAVTQRLGSAPDLMFNALFSIVPWLYDSPSNAPWRAEVFKRLTAALLAPSQYPAIRERAMAALVASRDKNVMFIFKQAVRSTDPNVRRLACVGMGALGDTEAIKDLQSMMVDPEKDVQLAAGLALGSIGSDAALETMVTGLLEGEPNLQQAIAEALAAIPEEGHATLRDAVTAKDMQIRRAAVFGLARIKTAWALSLLYRALLEDEQWYVKNAAEQAFRQMESFEKSGPKRHPEADSLEWLIAWAAKQGEGVPAGLNARQVLIRVLQEGDPATRAAAARTLANLGHIPGLKPLYGALRDKDDSVRAAVYDSLNLMQTRLGEALPAVV